MLENSNERLFVRDFKVGQRTRELLASERRNVYRNWRKNVRWIPKRKQFRWRLTHRRLVFLLLLCMLRYENNFRLAARSELNQNFIWVAARRSCLREMKTSIVTRGLRASQNSFAFDKLLTSFHYSLLTHWATSIENVDYSIASTVASSTLPSRWKRKMWISQSPSSKKNVCSGFRSPAMCNRVVLHRVEKNDYWKITRRNDCIMQF